MTIKFQSQNLINPFKIISFFLLINIASAASAQNSKCPFQYLYHFGDGVTDVGNSVLRLPWGPFLPPTRPPYGKTFPGRPIGRWSDGRIDFDYAAIDLGLPVVPYLSMNTSEEHDGVIFSVARSPVLDHEFFSSRDVTIPTYAAPLSLQLSWLKKYLKSICSNPTDCANRLGNALLLFGDIEANDIGYSLVQGKSIQEVQTYIPYITQATIRTAEELIKMGATTLLFPSNAPLGCYPYILTALQTNDSTAYDDLGCLKSVNDLIMFKNNDLKQAFNDLNIKFPNVAIYCGDFYKAAISYINETSSTIIERGGRSDEALKACCGIGGKYNYDSKRFCGSHGVPVCSNPEKYIYWDGLHFTQEAYRRIEHILVGPAMVALNCTTIAEYGTKFHDLVNSI